MPRAPSTTAELITLIAKSGIVPPEKLSGLSEQSLPADPRKAAAAIVAQGTVTKFQATQLLSGRHKGFRIGAYAIQDILGRGGMGAVYLAEHVELHRKVAIKVLVPSKEEDQRLAVERFQREARSAAALDHPNIVRIFDVSRHLDVPYLVMEYVEGETLQQLIDRDGPIPYSTASEYIAQAASGLQHAYEKGFIHRDIKPGNLVRDQTGTIKILDMGLARSANPQDKLTALLDNGAVVGTADFIAPEQAINNQSVDIRADIYSLGASLFALIAGKPPFEGNTTQKLLQHQLRSAPTLASVNASLPKGLSEVVNKMLAKKAEERYRTPAEVISALTPWMENSARILVGISCTSLAEDEALQATLSGIHRSSSNSQRLKCIADEQISSAYHSPQSEKETADLSFSHTTREPKRSSSEPARTGRSRRVLYAAAVVLMASASGFGGWLAFGREKKSDNVPVNPSSDSRAKQDNEITKAHSTNTSNAEVPAKTKTATPTTTKTATPSKESTSIATTINSTAPAKENTIVPEKEVFQFDSTVQQPFIQHSGLLVDPNDPNKKQVKILDQTGPGEPPPGWRARCWNKDSEMDFFVESFGGSNVLGIRNSKGPASSMLFSPAFECVSGLCRMKLEYQASLRERKLALKFKPSDQRQAWEVAFPPVTGDIFQKEDLIVDLRGAVGGYFEFHNTDSDPKASFRLRSIAVSELKPAVPLVEKVLFELDAADVPQFRTTRLGSETKDGDSLPTIKGVNLTAYKKETLHEWSCGQVDGVKAIGLTNVNDVRSTQIAVELESEYGLDLQLEESQRLRLRVTYRTAGLGRGNMYFQTYGDWKGLGTVMLPNSNNEWKTVELYVVRGDKPIRCVIDTSEPGQGNTLYIRSVSVVSRGKLPSLTGLKTVDKLQPIATK
jgi:serine/threonine protein kinase